MVLPFIFKRVGNSFSKTKTGFANLLQKANKVQYILFAEILYRVQLFTHFLDET
jgi:hypothetical protein